MYLLLPREGPWAESSSKVLLWLFKMALQVERGYTSINPLTAKFSHELLTNVSSNHIYPSSTLNKEFFLQNMVT